MRDIEFFAFNKQPSKLKHMSIDISIIIPVFNCQKYLKTAILSALAQPEVKSEVIVVDDGSTDNSLEIAYDFGCQINVISQNNQGGCAARNTGLAVARGNFIKFLDADDYLLPGVLQKQLAHAVSLGPRHFSYGRVMRHLENDGRLIAHAKRDRGPVMQSTLKEQMLDPPAISAMLYPVDMLESIGGFDTRLVQGQDRDLFARALLAGYRPVACPATIFAYRFHDNPNRVSKRSSRDVYKNQAKMFERLAKVLTDLQPNEDTKLILAGLVALIWSTARRAMRAGYADEASHLFSLARSLDPKTNGTGTIAYKALLRLFGPVITERLLERMKKSLRQF